MSALVQSLLGIWKTDGEVENFANYLLAIGLPESIIEGALKSVVVHEWSVSGDQITHCIRTSWKGGKEHKTTFKIGEQFDENPLGGRHLKTTFTEEGGKLVKRQLGTPYNCTTTIEIVGDHLVETMTCESCPPVSCVRRMIR